MRHLKINMVLVADLDVLSFAPNLFVAPLEFFLDVVRD